MLGSELHKEAINKICDSFLIEKTIMGGEGFVFICKDKRLDFRRVVVKIVHEEIWQSEENLQRFLQGTTFQAKLASKRLPVPQIYFCGTNYIIMEFIYGVEIVDYAKDNKLDETLEVFAKLCETVNEIHEHAIIHRDIKPSNIIVDKKGIPWLLDWGLAKEPRKDRNLTFAGAQLGTKGYASKNQMTDSSIADYPDDIFALGRLFYSLITKERIVPTKEEIHYLDVEIDFTSLGEQVYIECYTQAVEGKFKTAKQLANFVRKKILRQDYIVSGNQGASQIVPGASQIVPGKKDSEEIIIDDTLVGEIILPETAPKEQKKDSLEFTDKPLNEFANLVWMIEDFRKEKQ